MRGSGCDMIKIVTLFLIFIAVLAMFGRLRIPKISLKRDKALPKPRQCKTCGRMDVTGKGCETCNDKKTR